MSGKKKLAPSNIKIIKNGTIISGKDLAQSFNTFFLSVNNDISPLPSASQPIPKIFPHEVCTKYKVSKFSDPDGIPNRVIQRLQPYEKHDAIENATRIRKRH